MVDVPTRTLRDYLASLQSGGTSGAVSQELTIRNDFATSTQAVPPGGTAGQVLAKVNSVDFNVAWTTAGVGDMLKSVYDPQNKNADAFARANQTGTQSYTTITGLGTAATANSADFATAAQGALATTSVQPNAVQTLTNKRITPRILSQASTATLTPNSDSYDVVALTAQAANLTIAAPTGTPTDGQSLIIRIRDNGTVRTIAWNAAYSGFVSEDLPPTTVISKTMIYQFIWNATTNAWDLLSGNPVPAKWGFV